MQCLRPSSYKNAKDMTYEHIFQVICFLIKPTKIVEFGILDGFSLNCFRKYAPKNCSIVALDIFDDFVGNHANESSIRQLFSNYDNVEIIKGNYYEYQDNILDNSIDILHIDIANTGDTYKHAIQYYTSKLSENGIFLLEGGSEERDSVHWMNKYQKTPIHQTLVNMNLINMEDYTIITPFPSLTIIKKKI